MTYQPHNYLITGAAGFIGCNFVRWILGNDSQAKVVSLDKLTYAGDRRHLEHLPNADKHVFVEGDIVNYALMLQLLREHNIDTIVHFAAESHVDRSIDNPFPFVESNVVGTASLLEAARQVWMVEKDWNETQCRFHHISTDEVFGSLSKTDAAFTETTPYCPSSPYSASKAASDHFVRVYHHTYQLPVTLSNCSNNYGPYQHREKLIPTIIRACMNQEPIPLYGDGSNIRDWLYVTDHCDAIHRIICHGRLGHSYNVGAECERDNSFMVHAICLKMDVLFPEHAPHHRLITRVADRKGHDWRYAINSEKIQKELNWTAKTSLDQGLSETIAFYLEAPVMA